MNRTTQRLPISSVPVRERLETGELVLANIMANITEDICRQPASILPEFVFNAYGADATELD